MLLHTCDYSLKIISGIKLLPDVATDKSVEIVSSDQVQVHKVVYISHCSDSREWITFTLKPILDELNVDILTMEDVAVGQNMLAAPAELIRKADKIIVIFSLQSSQSSMESKWLCYDLDQAEHRNPDPSYIGFIPILFGDIKQEDLPRSLHHVIVLKADSTFLKEKLKQSIFN